MPTYTKLPSSGLYLPSSVANQVLAAGGTSGLFEPYALTAGTNVTLTRNDTAKTLTVTGASGGGSGGASFFAAAVVTVSGTTPTLASQKNVASVSRTGAGRWRLTFTTAAPDANYGVTASAQFPTYADDNVPVTGIDRRSGYGRTTTTLDITTTNPQNIGATDVASFSVLVFYPASL